MFLFCSRREFMDWALAIEINRTALTRIVASLVAMAGLAGGGVAERLSRSVYLSILRVLRPAESAVRRLVVMAARGLVVKPVAARPMPVGRIIIGRGGNARKPFFQLFDPRKTFGGPRIRKSPPRLAPRVRVIGYDPRISMLWRPAVPKAGAECLAPDEGLVSAVRLARRLEAVKLALDDIPRQAKRLVRWQARRARQDVYPPKFTVPLRPGRPPGFRAEPDHDVDDILIECHRLALDAMRNDTS